MVAALDIEEFQTLTDVSRETLERLKAYEALLRRWQPAVNLVGAATLRDPWRRHFLDSAQLYEPIRRRGARALVDLGSGAGFPGLVLAILGVPEVHLIEADTRKCAFLREAARVTAAQVTIHAARIESVPPWPCPVVTARACAPLDTLLGYAAPFLGDAGLGLFLKGRSVDRELTAARKRWHIRVERLPSRSDPAGVLLAIGILPRDRQSRPPQAN